MPLTDAGCRNAKPGPSPRKMSDGGGLYLLIQPSGSKLWRMNYRQDGKQKTLAFGAYPVVTLAEAREKRLAAKRAILRGMDPRNPDPGKATFEQVAREWYDLKQGTWVPGHAARVLLRLEADIFSQFGAMPIEEIEAPTILAALRKVEARGALETSKRLRQSVGAVFRFAVATNRATRDPAADLRDALKPRPRVRHMAALKMAELPQFFEALAAYDGDPRTPLAIELVMHTLVRTNELLGAVWGEIDGSMWRIPASKMKMHREHLVPLTPRSLELLGRLRALADDDRVLSLSSNTMIYAMYRMGYHKRATIHGMRGLGSTVLNESGLWSPDAIERQLAHVPANEVRGAYNAATYWPERLRMMTWWSEQLERQAGR